MRYLQKFVRRKHRGHLATGNATELGGGPVVLVAASRRRDFGSGPPSHTDDHEPSQASSRVGETGPVEPGENDCCGNGCQECVWTVYWDELAQHQGCAGVREQTAFELLEARLRREQTLRDKQATAAATAAIGGPKLNVDK